MTTLHRKVLPPFFKHYFNILPQDILNQVYYNPHPTDLLLDTSVFSISRIPLILEMLISHSPILLDPVLNELEDLKVKPELAKLREIVFPGGLLNIKFKADVYGVLKLYPRFSTRYINLLRWRRQTIDKEIRRIEQETGCKPVGKKRADLIQQLIDGGIATQTIKIANKEFRTERIADEVLALFAVLSPIVTGRDCFLFTADEDVFEQTHRLTQMLFDDYGAYLIAKDLTLNETRYRHRHPYSSPLFTGDAEAIGRSAHPDYLLPPPALVKTCATTVIDIGRLKGFTWVSARNMEIAIEFQEHDLLGRRGDPGMDRSILFTSLHYKDKPSCCKEKYHFVIGTPLLLTLSDEYGPMPVFDLIRANMSSIEPTGRQSKIITPFAYHQQRLLKRLMLNKRRR
jgi:hypothetical protein